MSDVTRLLDAASAGDRAAAAELLPLVYDELRKLAAARMAAEAVGHTLDATALVHEAYLRLVGPADLPRWQNSGHFFAAAAEAMRRILIDSARRKQSLQHGGDRTRVPVSEDIPANTSAIDALLDVDAVVDELAAHDSAAAELVKLHVFAGLPIERIAAVLGISPRTAYRSWEYARVWMFRRLNSATRP